LDEAAFLDSHDNGIGKLLGIDFISATKDRVVAEIRLEPAHYTRDGIVHGGILMALADCTGAYGAVLNLPPGHMTGTIESKTNFLRRGRGETLRAEALPIHVGRLTSVWRTTISRGDSGRIAEVTQTQFVLPESRAPAAGVGAAVSTTAAPVPVPDAQIRGNGGNGGVAADRKRQIFEGACAVISRKGFAAATIREIAAAAGMPVPTMYQYIERKEDLLYFIYDYFMRDYTDGLERSLGGNETATERLSAAIRETFDSFDRNRAYVKLMFQETGSLSAEGREKVYALDSHYIEVWRALLTDAAASGEVIIGEPELVANFIYFLCTVWPLRHWTIGRHGRAAVARELDAFILRGLGMTAGGDTTDNETRSQQGRDPS
jgi:uncharacterized protein (TIGR00369 family)